MLSKKEIQNDFDKMYKILLTNNYNEKTLQMKQYLKLIHKASYIFGIWRIHLLKLGVNKHAVNEIASTFIQVIHISIYRDVKILYMLYRNIIDNFIKILKKKLNIDAKYTKQVFEEILKIESVNNNKVLDDSFRKILNLYKKSCGYVHTQDKKYMSFNKGIKNYNNNMDNKLNETINDFYNLIKYINYIFIFMFDDIYEKGFDPEEKKIIHYFCSERVLKDIFFIKYGTIY